MRHDIEDHVLRVDHDMDGYGSMEEFLTTFKELEVEKLV